MADFNYQVFSPDGVGLMEAPESCRYPRKIELSPLSRIYNPAQREENIKS